MRAGGAKQPGLGIGKYLDSAGLGVAAVSGKSRRSARPILVLTGDRRRGRYLVKLQHKPLWLSPTLYSLLCELVAAERRKRKGGFLAVPPYAIYRLRGNPGSLSPNINGR